MIRRTLKILKQEEGFPNLIIEWGFAYLPITERGLEDNGKNN